MEASIYFNGADSEAAFDILQAHYDQILDELKGLGINGKLELAADGVGWESVNV